MYNGTLTNESTSPNSCSQTDAMDAGSPKEMRNGRTLQHNQSQRLLQNLMNKD